MERIIHILHLEDDLPNADLVRATLAKAGFNCRISRVRSQDEFETVLDDGNVDIILADHRLPMFDGLSALQLARRNHPDIPFIFVSETVGEEAVIQAFTQGATDYVLKQNLSRLVPAVRQALKKAGDRKIREQAQEELRQSNDMLRAIVEAAPVGIIGLDLEGHVHSVWNPAAEKMLGWSAAEVMGRPLPSVQADRQEEFRQFREQIRKGLTLDGVEVRRQKRDGTPIDYSIFASPLHDTQGRISGNISVLVDITKRKRNNMIDTARFRLMQFATSHSLDELLEQAVNEAEEMTESRIGFLHFVDDDQQSLTLRSWSTRTKARFCKARSQSLHSPISGAGVWVDCVHEGKPVIHNDYLSLPHRKDLPEGHPEIIRELVAPVMRENKVKMVLGVGNKPIDYSKNDMEAMSLLADFIWEIVEKKQVEQQLDLMNFALSSIHEIVLMIDENARFYYVNDEACRLVGYSRDELLTMTLADLNPNFSKKLWHKHWNTLKERGTSTIESRHRTKDGRLIPVEFNANYFEYQGQSYDLGLGRDISERKQMERERQANFKFFESMDKVNQAIQGTNDLEQMMGNVLDAVVEIFDCDKTHLIFPCNPQAVAMSVQMERIKPEYAGVIPVGVQIPVTPEIAEHNRLSLTLDRPVLMGADMDSPLTAEQIKAGDQSAMGMAIYPKNSEAWAFSIGQCSHPRIWTPEEMTLFEAIGRRLADSLTSLLAYRDLYKSEAFLNSIVEHIPNMLFVKEAQTLKYIRFNEAGEQLLGYSREELEGRTNDDLFPKEMADLFRTRDRKVLDGREPLDIPDETIRDRNNEERVFHSKLIPILDEVGMPQYLLGISEDITQRKKLEAQLSQSQKMEAVGQLAGGVAHDFNNMLGVIIGRSELALAKVSPNDSLQKDLEDILSAANRSAEITRQLLAFARKQTIIPKILDLNETVEGMLKLLRRLIGEGIDLGWLPGTKLWPVKMDPSQVDQILANLCVNARDAIAGVGKITIETQKIEFDDAYCAEHKGFSPGEYVMLAVSDNGGGMEKSTMDKIFEPFFTTKEMGKGTGLGLATVYGIVKQNAGFINVYSEPQHGSTFKIYLPRHSDSVGREPKTDQSPSTLAGRETILIVEDEVMYLQISKSILERYGYQVLTASTPGEALGVAKKHDGEIHLLLTDLIMPEMNGRDLAKEIVSLFPSITCLFMSGYTDNVIVHHGVLEEGVHFIQKPFSNQTLAGKVRELLDIKKGQPK